MEVARFPLENVAREDLEKHGEPEVMQGAHRAQEDACEGDERLEDGQLARELHLGEDKPDHLGQAVDARHEPSYHAADEGHRARVLKRRAVQALRHPPENVSDVVQVGDNSAEGHDVAEDVAEVERDGGDMVQQHLLEVVDALVKEEVLQ